LAFVPVHVPSGFFHPPHFLRCKLMTGW
jgi:hypothetical protein